MKKLRHCHSMYNRRSAVPRGHSEWLSSANCHRIRSNVLRRTAAADRRLSEHCRRINRFVGATRDVSAMIVIGRDTLNCTFASGEIHAAWSGAVHSRQQSAVIAVGERTRAEIAELTWNAFGFRLLLVPDGLSYYYWCLVLEFYLRSQPATCTKLAKKVCFS